MTSSSAEHAVDRGRSADSSTAHELPPPQPDATAPDASQTVTEPAVTNSTDAMDVTPAESPAEGASQAVESQADIQMSGVEPAPEQQASTTATEPNLDVPSEPAPAPSDPEIPSLAPSTPTKQQAASTIPTDAPAPALAPAPIVESTEPADTASQPPPNDTQNLPFDANPPPAAAQSHFAYSNAPPLASQHTTPMRMQQSQQSQADMIMGNHGLLQTPATITPAVMSNLDEHAYMMLALVNGGQNAMSPPPTVTPSQVTLPSAMEMSNNNFAATNPPSKEGVDSGLQSFARIEFADSVFQMTTYSVIIGRDIKAIAAAKENARQTEEHRLKAEDHARRGLPPPMPMVQERTKFSKSYVSEEGGMLGPESDSEESGRPSKRRKTSTAGSSQADIQEAEENMILNRQYVSHTPGAAAVDLALLRPDPYHIPIVAIHSPGPDMAAKTRAISREHLKIAYNHDTGVFEAIPLHKNGFFHEDVHFATGKVVLKSGSRLQVKDVAFRFIINGVERGRTGAEKDKAPPKNSVKTGGKEMSFDFEQAHGNGNHRETSEDELSELEGSLPELSGSEEEEIKRATADREANEGEPAERETIERETTERETMDRETAERDTSEIKSEPQFDAEAQAQAALLAGLDPAMEGLPIPTIPKKRGPGRPPKNGIMSKREQRLLKKQQQEMAKKTLPQPLPTEPPIKRKVGRPRKHPLPEGEDRPEKRKYKPRAPKLDGEGSDAERRAREKKEKRARPKSPPLELKIEDYTEEQLQKPNKNYGMLIDETLTAAPDGLTLKQIYKRICQRYPWFHFHTETKGWESSVRHNLIGNEAFKKDETTNLWSRVPGVELDAGKKRKATSPDRALAAQGYGPYSYAYGHQQMGQAGAGYQHGQFAPGYQMQAYAAQQQQQTQPGRPPQAAYGPAGSPPQGQPSQPGGPQAAAQAQGFAPSQAATRPPTGIPQQPPGGYGAQFAARPQGQAPNNPAIKMEDGRPSQAGGPQHPAVGAAHLGNATAATPHATPGQPAAPQQHPVSQQQQAQAAAGRPPAATPPSGPPRPVIDPKLLGAVVGLKNGLKHATENEKMESICMRGIGQVINGYPRPSKSPTPGAAGSPATEAAPSPVFEPKVLTSLLGFKDVSVKALSQKLGEARAEAVALSAIDRALGLATASIVTPPAENGEGSATPTGATGSGSQEGGNGQIESLETYLIQTTRQLIEGMNLKVVMPPAKTPSATTS
ncbi:forkhead domain-containing protein [Sarocladium implicatum]|nr:forkhead domain-containing protein [Sarocladium implicatum]